MTGALPTIERAGDDEADPRFLHALLCHLGLPRSAVAERSFMRATGNASILIEAGQRWTGIRFEPQPLPYGSRPRLALVHICSEAVRTKRREIDIGRSTRDFLERLHIRPGGTDMRLFRRRLRAAWHDNAVRRPRHAHRPRHRRMPAAAPGKRVHPLPAPHRPDREKVARHPSRARQLRDPQGRPR